MENMFQYILVAVVISATLMYLQKGTGAQVFADSSGRYTLRVHRLYQGIGIVLAIIGAASVIAIQFSNVDSGMAIGGLIVLLLFAGAGVSCYIFYRNHKLIFDSDTISVTTWLNKSNEIRWVDIKEMKFNPIAGMLTISDGTKTLKVHQHLVGLSTFMKEVEKQTQWTAKALKVPVSPVKG